MENEGLGFVGLTNFIKDIVWDEIEQHGGY